MNTLLSIHKHAFHRDGVATWIAGNANDPSLKLLGFHSYRKERLSNLMGASQGKRR